MTGMNNRDISEGGARRWISRSLQRPNWILSMQMSHRTNSGCFYPEDGEGPYPLVIVFHGGAFAAGHKGHVH